MGAFQAEETDAKEGVVALEGMHQGVGQGRNLIRMLYWGRIYFQAHLGVVGKIQSCVGCWAELIRLFLGVGWKLSQLLALLPFPSWRLVSSNWAR